MKLKPNFLKCMAIASALMPLLSLSTAEEREECGYIFDRYPSVYLPASTHWFAQVSLLGDSAVLEDGSVWVFSSYDGHKALKWISLDPSLVIPLTITQNFSWFSNYEYRIINQSTGESIPANLQLGPVKDNSNSRFVTAVDPATGIVVLNDNTRYQISSGDLHKLPALFDYMIRGQNGGWSSTYESILINVNMDNYVHAKQI